MATVKQCLEIIRKISPEELTYEYDNVGLLVGGETAEVKKIMTCLDVTETALDEAIKSGVQLIVSHHPMIFNSLKRVTDTDCIGRKIIKAIKNDINIYAAHTNLDFVTDGINDLAASLLGLENHEPLDAYIDLNQGFGRVGDLKEETTCLKLAEKAEKVFSDPYVRIIGENKRVKRIAVINGAGGGDTKYIDMALKAGADCLVTADVKHHVAIYALDNHLTIIEPQHYNMEYCFIEKLTEKIRQGLTQSGLTAEVFQSTSEVSPRKQRREEVE